MAEKYVIQLEVDSKGAVTNIDELTEAIKNTGKVAEKELKNVDKDLEGVGEGSKDAKKGVTKLDLGFKGLGASMKAAGIGLIVSAFLFLKEALSSNQEVMDVINVTFETFNIITKQLTDIIVDNVKVIYNALQNFEQLGKVIKGVVDIGLFPMRHALLNLERGFLAAQLAWEKSFFGNGDAGKIKQLQEDISGVSSEIKKAEDGLLENAKNIGENFGGALEEILQFGKVYNDNFVNQFTKLSEISISSAIDQANNLVQLKKNAELAAAENRLLMQQFDRQAEQQRQIRDDESATMEERIAANKKLGEILQEQEKIMIENADAILLSAQAQFEKTGLDEDYIKVLDAQAEKAGVLAAIEGKRSEQLVNTNTLQREAADKQKEIDDEKIENAKTAADEEIRIAKEVADAKKTIRNAELDNIANGVNVLSKLAPKSKALQAAGIIASNAVGIAKIIQNTTASNAAARLKYALIPGGQALAAAEIAANKVSAGINIATSVAATAKGLAALKSGGSATTSTSLPSDNGGGAQEPQFNIVGQGAGSQIASALGEQQQAPIQAFVVSQDVTTAQSLENNIIQGATLGG